MEDIIARRERRAAKREEEQQVKKVQEQRGEFARTEQEEKLRRARDKMELLALQRARKTQDPTIMPQIQEEPAPFSKQPISQEEKYAIAEFLARKEEEKRTQEKMQEHVKMMEKCHQDWIAKMQ